MHGAPVSRRVATRAFLVVAALASLVLGGSARVGASSPPPLFVGPGVVSLDGGRGGFAWDRVEFGAEAVRLVWDASAGTDACRVTTRVATPSGERIARHVAILAPGARRDGRPLLAVGHASAAMTIRSSCPSWHVRLRAAPEDLGVTLRHDPYRITGSTPAAIWSSIRARSPWGWPAYTGWRWGTSCGDVTVTVALPRWIRPAGASESLADRWMRFAHALRRHEYGHVTLVRQAVARGEGCLRTADAWSAVQARSDRYDALTDHGRTQGAWWSW